MSLWYYTFSFCWLPYFPLISDEGRAITLLQSSQQKVTRNYWRKKIENNKMTSFPSRLGMPNGIFFFFSIRPFFSAVMLMTLDSSYLAYRELKWQLRQHSDVSEFDPFNWKYAAIDIRPFQDILWSSHNKK